MLQFFEPSIKVFAEAKDDIFLFVFMYTLKKIPSKVNFLIVGGYDRKAILEFKIFDFLNKNANEPGV